ncbi:HEPN domain-containing protein [Sphingomonas aerolata]|uniref:HEPN domain-containing protein n=1 Tax=Sphingomonas aerolata TaxID=185951 RepID=UPI00208FD2DF|nr:HEPN domain-containing protein [Sphingomonas aerolata]USQ99550.1 HEPN domain-containing protein [Sphingomonas aerolata]
MTLKIDNQAADSLILRIADGINRTSFFFGPTVSDFTWATDITKPLPGSLHDTVESICGDRGLAIFMYGQVMHRLLRSADYDETDTEDISKLEAFADRIKVARDIVEELKALPYKYRLAVPLPSSFSADFLDLCENYDLGSGLSICSGAYLENQFPIETGVDLIDAAIASAVGKLDTLQPDSDTLYLVQNKSGYVSGQMESPMLAEFKSTHRQFLGAALAVKAVTGSGWHFDKSIGGYAIHHRKEGFELVSAEQMPPQLIEFYSRMHRPRPTKPETKKSPSTPSNRENKLSAIKSVFSNNEHSRGLSIATIWYLRSVLSQDTLDGLLESTIALEALLGGANSEGTKLSSLLGSRCAYLIGRSVKDRNDILKKFTEIYKLRSQIVHEGHHSFTKIERSLLTYSREMCRRAIVAEMRLPVGA